MTLEADIRVPSYCARILVYVNEEDVEIDTDIEPEYIDGWYVYLLDRSWVDEFVAQYLERVAKEVELEDKEKANILRLAAKVLRTYRL